MKKQKWFEWQRAPVGEWKDGWWLQAFCGPGPAPVEFAFHYSLPAPLNIVEINGDLQRIVAYLQLELK